MVKGLRVPGLASATRKETDELIEFAKQYGAKGLVTLALLPEGPKSPLAKFMSEEELGAIISLMGGETGDLLLFVADDAKVANDVLWRLRVRMGVQLKLIDPEEMALCWVVDFPLLEVIEENGVQRYHATHNPFSGMQPGHETYLETEPLKAIARQYDIVGNGYEIGGGSIRINVPELQRTMFRLFGLSDDEIEEQFGHMLEAFELGGFAAPRRHRARHRPAGDAAGERRDDPRRDGVPENAERAGRADARALAGGGRAVA